jgi:predicted flap endonuclease-1-like 5' DNA nuclease
MMEPVQALAIVSLGAFVGVLVTAVFYVAAWRTRLNEPESLNAVGAADESLYDEPSDRAAALVGIGERLDRQEQKLDRLQTRLDNPTPTPDQAQMMALVEAQTGKLSQISAHLDAWALEHARSDEKLNEHARTLAELDQELAAQAQAVRLLDTKISEHTTMLVTAAAERREQAGLLQRILDQIGQMIPSLTRLSKAPPLRPGQDRLTDIRGIGPVYASKLYEAGIQTFRQLASMTPEEIYNVLNLPAWRMRSANAANWIEQAEHFASQREKVEGLLRES